MRRTLIISPSVRTAAEGDELFMDEKAVAGLRLYARYWGGPVRCLMRSGDRKDIVFGRFYKKSDLGFDVEIISDDLVFSRGSYDDAAIVLAAGDNHHDFNTAKICGCPVVFVIENTLSTRLRILSLEGGSLLKKTKSAIWAILTERNRRLVFSEAAGIQANGKPAFDAYRGVTSDPMLYFDTRVSEDQVATMVEIERKRGQSKNVQPLRMAFSGRLERLKGVDHLVPVLQKLADNGMSFTFDIFGSGSLRPEIEKAVRVAGLDDRVILHGPVSFNEVLLPYLKSNIDMFICCHRQSDPSCTYIETLACGVPIVGYDNAAFRGVLELGNVGESVPMNNTTALARAILAIEQDRSRLRAMAVCAIDVAFKHSFEATYLRRVRHLEALAARV